MSRLIDLTGRKFNRLTVLHRVVHPSRDAHWLCLCECGNTTVVGSQSLKNGDTKACGCLRTGLRNGPYKGINLYGNRFGSLIAMYPIFNTEKRRYEWFCMCDCGNSRITTAGNLRYGYVKSCGCMRKGPKVGCGGPNHYNRNNNLTEEERIRIRSIDGYTEWRKAVFERDRYSCIRCGGGGYLNAHHLEDYANNPSLRTDISNGVTLCKKCHFEFHREYGRKRQTFTWQMLEFLTKEEN